MIKNIIIIIMALCNFYMILWLCFSAHRILTNSSKFGIISLLNTIDIKNGFIKYDHSWFEFYSKLNKNLEAKITLLNFWKYFKKNFAKASKGIESGEYYSYVFDDNMHVYHIKQTVPGASTIESLLKYPDNFFNVSTLKKEELFLALDSQVVCLDKENKSKKNKNQALIIKIYHNGIEKSIILTGDFTHLEFETCFKHHAS